MSYPFWQQLFYTACDRYLPHFILGVLAFWLTTPTQAHADYFHNLDYNAHVACDAEAASRPYYPPYGWVCNWASLDYTLQTGIITRMWYVRWAPGGNYPEGWGISRHIYPADPCLPGQGFVAPGECRDGVDTGETNPDKNIRIPVSCVGNPCDPGSGNKFLSESDFTGGEGVPIIQRYYNSGLVGQDFSAGRGWVGPHLQHFESIQSNRLMVRRSDGQGLAFGKVNGTWYSEADVKINLTQDQNGYTLTQRDGTIERYSNSGTLSSITDIAGRVTVFGYNSDSSLSTITGPFGHRLNITYDYPVRLRTVTTPDGQIITYDYYTESYNSEWHNTLTQVHYPDSTAKIYYYEQPGLGHHLTGISFVDSAGVATRYATYAYDSNGKAIRTEHAQTDNGSAQEKFTLAYDVPSLNQTTVTDPVGINEVMTFAATWGVKNLVNKINQSDGKSIQQTLDVKNNLTCRKDEENRVTLYSYNSANQKLSMTEGLSGSDCNTCLSNPANCNAGGVGRVTTYDYVSPTLDLPRFIRRPSVASGQTFETELQYNDAAHPNLPTAIIQRGFTPAAVAVSRTMTFGYNAYGQVNRIDGPRTDVSDITTLEYYECLTGRECGQLKKVTNALGHITTYDTYDANGRLLHMTDPNGLVTTYTYDARGRVKTVTQTPTSGTPALTQYSYTPWGEVSQVIDPDGVVLNYSYDAAHYLRTITDLAGNQIRYKYDLKGNRTQDYTYDPSGVLSRTVSATYDLRNHPSSATLANDTTQLVYDAVGNLTQETDPNTYATNHQHDALNRLFRTVDALGAVTGYGYDVNDRPTAVTATNNLSTTYSYDDLGNLLQEVSPDRRTTTYTYDAAGNVLTVKDARNVTTTYTYDALNRVVSKQSNNASTPSYSYVYDTCFKGRLCYFPGTLLFGYDGLGRLNYQLDLGTFFNSNYVFTSAGRLSHVDYPNGVAVDYQYDPVGRVSQVSTTDINGVTTVLASSFTYYPFGPINSFSFGNGRSYFTTFDKAYRPNFQINGPRYISLLYDPAGNLSGTDAGTSTQTFTYDALNELTSATTTQPGSYGSLAYDYLSNGVSSGNRQSETRNGSTDTCIYNGNRLANTNNLYWLYDAAGNANWSMYGYVMGYDGYGRMISAHSGADTYIYDPLDRRIRKSSGGTTTRFHAGPQGEFLYEAQGANTKAYVYLNGQPLARIDSGTTIYYYHTDHLGAPQVMTSSTGTVVWKANYEPFGSAAVTVSTVTNNLRLAGQYFDSETGLYYNGHRYYDPKIGRYISSDPIGLKGGLNTYLYVGANPLRWTDPRGLDNPSGGTWNGNVIPGFNRQDNVCTLGPLSSAANRNPCVRQCCVLHDICYTANQCNASSWLVTPLSRTSCGTCNWIGLMCALSSPTRDCEPCGANKK